MSALRRPGTLVRGDRVRYQHGSYTVLGLSGTLVRLADDFRQGPDIAVHLAVLQADPGFEIIGGPVRPAVPPSGLMDGLPKHLVDEANWREPHLLEVLFGLPPDAAPDAVPRAEYDPALRSLTQRE